MSVAEKAIYAPLTLFFIDQLGADTRSLPNWFIDVSLTQLRLPLDYRRREDLERIAKRSPTELTAAAASASAGMG